MSYRSLVLFVCTGNTCRSPMAERLFTSLLAARRDSARVRTASAGLWAHNGQTPVADVMALAAAQGLDLSQHRARTLTQQMVDEADLILVMERAHREDISLRFARTRGKVHLLSRVAGKRGDLADPLHQGSEAYALCLELLRTYLSDGYERIIALAEAGLETPRRRIRWPWPRR